MKVRVNFGAIAFSANRHLPPNGVGLQHHLHLQPGLPVSTSSRRNVPVRWHQRVYQRRHETPIPRGKDEGQSLFVALPFLASKTHTGSWCCDSITVTRTCVGYESYVF